MPGISLENGVNSSVKVAQLCRAMKKWQNNLCTQRRFWSAWASAQSDQSPCCPHEETLCPWLSIESTAKTLIRLGKCPGWSVSSLGTHFVGFVMQQLKLSETERQGVQRVKERHYLKDPKILDTRNIGRNLSEIWKMWLYHRVMCPKDAYGIAKSVEPYQTAPLGGGWSGSALCAQAYLSKNLGLLWYLREGETFIPIGKDNSAATVITVFPS